MRIGIFYFGIGRSGAQLPPEIITLGAISRKLDTIMADLAALKAQIEANKAVTDSAIVLINGIADRIQAAGTDPAQLQGLVDGLKNETDALASAVAANTPAAG